MEEIEKKAAEITTAIKATNDSVLELKTKHEEEIERMKTNQKALEDAILKLGEGVKNKADETFYGLISKQIKSAFETTDLTKSIKKEDGSGNKLHIVTKSTDTAAVDSVYGARSNKVQEFGRAKVNMTDIFPTVTIAAEDSEGMDYYYMRIKETSIVKAFDWIAENGSMPTNNVIEWEEVTETFKEVAGGLYYSRRFKRHWKTFAEKLGRFIETTLQDEVNSKLFLGDGTSDSLVGLYTRSTKFNAGAYTGVKYAGANIADLLEVLTNQLGLRKWNGTTYRADVVLMSEADRGLWTQKDLNLNYITLPTRGLSVYFCDFVPTNTMLVGGSNYSLIRQKGGVEMVDGYVNADILNGRKVIGLFQEIMLVNEDHNLFGYIGVTDINAAITAITI